MSEDITKTYITLSNGSMVSHYRINKKIGAGGMGEVYLAQDTKLDRRVALKLLPKEFAGDSDMKARFHREAKAAAKLNHPNIVTIHDFGEHLGRPFIAMEFVEGKSLKEFFEGKEIIFDEILSCIVQILEGLEEAHNAGITHRDIKPSNIIIDKRGRAKILDFGLATLPESEPLTKTGSTLGTVGYMSPEQIKGTDIDRRADLFSLGVVLYELITGKAPFKRKTEAETMRAVLGDTPEPLARFKSDLPEETERIARKLLEKDPALRYQTASGVISDLKQILRDRSDISSPSIATPTRKMVAVLPFQNLGPSDEEYFADGITEEIISRLAAVADIGVISRTSIMQYKNTQKPMSQIGEELRVQFVLEGTVRWAKSSGGGSRVRITPQLIKVADDTHLWSERYDREIDDIFEVQSDIAERVIEELNITLLEKERKIVCCKPTENAEAHHMYLRGMEHFNSPDYDTEEWKLAAEMFDRAVKIDPKFALGYARLSLSHTLLYFFKEDNTERRSFLAKQAAERALEIDPNLPEGHFALGYYYYASLMDYDSALREMEIARKGLPNDVFLLHVSAAIYRRKGDFKEAAKRFKLVCDLNPLDSRPPFEVGATESIRRNYKKANEYLDRSIALAPDQYMAYCMKALNQILWDGDTKSAENTLGKSPKSNEFVTITKLNILILSGNYSEVLKFLSEVEGEIIADQHDCISISACKGIMSLHLENAESATKYLEVGVKALERERDQRPEDYRVRASLGIAYAYSGNKVAALNEANTVEKIIPISKDALAGPYRALDVSRIYAITGELELSLDKLEHLMSIPCELSAPLLKLDPAFNNLRDHPRFERLLSKDLEPEN
ncbi:MAG: protein kinase [candidate division Zixibacteria bacterium]|nr:protein kinase [candidate division Zixibacteria bacterium]